MDDNNKIKTLGLKQNWKTINTLNTIPRDSVNSVAFDPNGEFVVFASGESVVKWDIKKQNAYKSQGVTYMLDLKFDSDVNSVAFSPDGKYIASAANYISINAASNGKKEKKLKVNDNELYYSVAFSPDGNYVVSGSDEFVYVWDVVSKDVKVKQLKGHEDIVKSVAFSPDGKYVVSGSEDETVRIWDIASQKEIQQFEGNSVVTSVAFSPDGKYVVFGSYDNIVRIWYVTVLTEIKIIELKGHSGWVNSVAFSPDGNFVVSGSNDNTVRIWNVLSGKEIPQPERHTDTVTSVAFSPNVRSGYIVVSGSEDGTMILHKWTKHNNTSFHASLVKSPSIESVSMPSIVDDFIEGEQPLSEYEYDIKDSDFPILFTDMKFPIKVMMKSRLENLLKDNHAIFYECKKETIYDYLTIKPENVHPQPYMKTTVFGLETVGDALIKIENIQNILKDSKKMRLKERQKKAIRKIGEESSMKESNMTPQSNIVNKVKSVLKIEKIPPRIYTFVKTKKTIERVASKAVLQRDNVVSAKHCQDQDKMTVYTLRQVKKRTKKRTVSKKSTSVSRKNKSR